MFWVFNGTRRKFIINFWKNRMEMIPANGRQFKILIKNEWNWYKNSIRKTSKSLGSRRNSKCASKLSNNSSISQSKHLEEIHSQSKISILQEGAFC